jgi:UDPglucose--hexose-1-phosphate uridylyltransferase
MNDEPELRRDPVTGRWVLIAPERARRPIALSDAGPRHRTTGERTPCPFCPGEEHDTPNEVFAIRDPGTAPDGPGWRLRVVPNKFPAVCPDVEPTVRVIEEVGSSLFSSAPAIGFAEVLIDCPEHIDSPTRLSDTQFADVLRAYRERMTALATDSRLAHVAVFKNVGAEAGASLGHTHSQIIATPIVPALMQTELSGAETYFARTGRCVFCDIVKDELAAGVRVVDRSERFVVVTAFAPRFAYEMWVLPVSHAPRYEAITDEVTLELAVLLKRVLRALDVVQHSPAYNWFLHTTPIRGGEPPHYHWHLEIIPRTARPAGLEWGHGCHITTASPEFAASELRAALPTTSG